MNYDEGLQSLDSIFGRLRPAGRLHIGDIANRAGAFEARLRSQKARLAAEQGIAWYPYHSLGGLHALEQCLTGQRRYLLELAGGDPVLDIGCADGDLSFFLESLGCRVWAIDFPSTNYNGMAGIRAMKAALNSQVEIVAADIDSQFALPDRQYGLAFFLGTLYHLKNPYYALETIAKQARYCVLSTRIARFAPDRRTSIKDLPLAYLLGEGEANADWTNYWIFSEAGLKRLLTRSGWDICDFVAVGNTSDSEPSSWEGDERAFCLLKSRPAEQAALTQRIAGWHELEYESWRWTEKRFSAALVAPPGNKRPALRLRFSLSEALIARFGSLEIAAEVNGKRLDEARYTTAGEHTYLRRLPLDCPAGDRLLFEFQLDNALPPDDSDPRERGIIVSSIRLE